VFDEFDIANAPYPNASHQEIVRASYHGATPPRRSTWETSGHTTQIERRHTLLKKFRSLRISQLLWIACSGWLANLHAATQIGSDRPYDPQHQPAIQTQRAGVTTSLVGKPTALGLKLVGNGSGERLLSLPATLVQVDSLSWFGDDRLTVLGMANSSISAIVVVDVHQAKVIDYFLGLDPVISPDGRYIAFVRFYPSHGIESAEDRVRIYDLAQSASSNRPVKSPGAAPSMEVGRPVYPLLPDEAARFNTDRPEEDAYHRISDFEWSSDSRSFAFGMTHGAHEMDVVLGSPADDTVSTASVSSECGSSCESLRITKIQFSATGIAMQLNGVGDRVGRRKDLVIKRSEFSAQPFLR
jgi:hypothetical protein